MSEAPEEILIQAQGRSREVNVALQFESLKLIRTE